MTDEQIINAVRAARRGVTIIEVADMKAEAELASAIMRYAENKPNDFMENEYYGRVQRVMSTAPGPNGTRFHLGVIVMTAAIAARGIDGQLAGLLLRHSSGDWGEVDDEDSALNDQALRNGQRVLSAYLVDGERVWIITEWDRSMTTILRPEDY